MNQTCIFYDLETTDKDPVGQIINLCFIVTDGDFKVLDEFSRDIKIGRLQLPRAGAILANRTDVIAHQKNNPPNEKEVLGELWQFLNDVFVQSKRVTIVGFNNLGFDQNYLRTSFIRNGLSPYYQKHVTETDLFCMTQFLSISRNDFPRAKSKKERKDGKERISLSLESVTKALGLLDGIQTHHSRDDVLLTVELAKKYRDQFGSNIIGFSPYQAGSIHAGAKKEENRGKVFLKRDTQYDLSNSDLFTETPYMFLDATHRYSLWVDIEAFKKGYKSLRFIKADQGIFFTDAKPVENKEFNKVAVEALEKFKKVNLQNYFTETECDIEQHIYRVDFSNIEALNTVIWHGGEAAGVTLPDAKKVLGRFRLANYKTSGKQDDIFMGRLKDYALYRYGGNMRMDKGIDLEDRILEKKGRQYFHPTWNALIKEIDEKIESGSKEDVSLMKSLKKFYLESEIYAVAGKELEAIPIRETTKDSGKENSGLAENGNSGETALVK